MATALRERRLSSVELTRSALDRAQAAQETVGAFMVFMEDTAMAAAERADQERAQGKDRGPLHGVPIGVKDILATSDAPTTANSLAMDPNWGRRQDATSVHKLREAGAVIIGKLVLHEFAIGWPDPATGMRFARNPWDLSRLPGGSSSGTGAAVAAGLIPAGLGTDTGGSIRGPAAATGISGLKPTFGRVSKEGCVPLAYSLDHIGPMARTMRDCALLLRIIAGFDSNDPCSVHEPVPDYSAALDGSLRGVRIGVPRQYFFDQPELDPEIGSAVEAALQLMAQHGATVRDVSIPHAHLSRTAQRVIMFGEAYAYHQTNLAEQADRYGQYTRRQLLQGALYSAGDYVQAQRVRSLLTREALAAMADVDVLIMPSSAAVATVFDGYDPDAARRAPTFMALWNLTGQPAASICCGFSRQGLPIGMQLVGKPFEESTVLRVGDAYQQVTDWHTRAPEALREAQSA